MAPLAPAQGRDLLEIIDDRHGRGSTLVTSQLPVDHWHEIIGDPTVADAILDRLVQSPSGVGRLFGLGCVLCNSPYGQQ